MAEAHEALVSEVDRIVSSPYPTQLKTLRDLVFTRCSNFDIDKCVQLRLCQVDRLASCLLEGLQQWPYVADIVARLSYNVAVRDALLRQAPQLLHDVLEQATKTDNISSKYVAVAVAILSHPLPSGHSIPAATQALFLRLIEHAALDPSAANVKPVFLLLRGTATLLLGLLSNETLKRFEERLFSILRRSSTRTSTEPGDQLLTLHCLAIMRVVACAADDQLVLTNSLYQTQELFASTQPTSPRWSATEMQNFFTGAGAHKTLKLVSLHAVWACQASGGPFGDRAEALELANLIIDPISVDIKDSWCSTNTGIVHRLQQKALACDADSSLRLQAFAFLTQLCKPVFLQIGVVESIRESFARPDVLRHPVCSDSGCLSTNSLVAVLDKATVESMLQRLPEYLLRCNAADLLQNFHAVVEVLQSLCTMAEEHRFIPEAACTVMASTRFEKDLHRLVDSLFQGVEEPTECRLSACSGLYRTSRIDISQKLAAFLLSCALTTDNSHNMLSAPLISLLLQLHSIPHHGLSRCPQHPTGRRTPPEEIHFVEHESTQHDAHTDWRAALKAQAVGHADAQYETLSRVFAQACAALEARCESVEQPLREEMATRRVVENQLNQMQAAYAELEAESIDKKLHFDSLEAEMDQRLQELDAARRRVQETAEERDQVTIELQAARSDASQRIQELQTARDDAELQHATALAEKQGALDELQERLVALGNSLGTKNAEFIRLQDDFAQARSSHNVLQEEAENTRASLREKCEAVESLEQAARDSTDRQARLEYDLQTVREDLVKAEEAHNQHVQQVKEHAKQNVEAANASYNETMDRLAAQHGEEVANLERQLSDLRENELRQAALRHAEEVSARDEEIDKLRRLVDRLQRRCEQKDQQIAELNTMRANLMAAMGLGALQPSLPHRTRPSFIRTQGVDSQQDLSPPSPLSADDHESQPLDGRASFASNASSTHSRSGPTPKRAKPRKLFKAPSPAKPRLSISARASRIGTIGRSAAKRQPLADVSANRSPRKELLKTPSKGMAGYDANDFDDSTIDENVLFGKTPGAEVDLEHMLHEQTEL